MRQLAEMARSRGQSLAQMAVAWVLRHSAVTSAVVGASRVEQIEDCVASLGNPSFTDDELAEIDRVLSGSTPLKRSSSGTRCRQGCI